MCTYLSKRGATYYFRRKIPDDLRTAFSGAGEFMFSLRTKDREEAKQRIPDHTKLTDRMFEEARAKVEPAMSAQGGAAVISPSPNSEHRLAALTEAQREEIEFEQQQAEAKAERRRRRKPKRDEFRRRLEYSTARLSSTEQVARDLIRERDEEIRRLRDQPYKPEREAEAAPTAKAGNANVMLDTTIVDKWAAERKVQPKGKDTHRAVARWFYDRVGTMPVDKIARHHVITFKTKLLSEGQSLANIKMKLSRLRTLLSWAFQNDYAAANVAEGIGIIDPSAGRNKRKSFDLASLNAVFGSPIYNKGERPTQGRGEAAYWLPLLALFTGARMEELGQLRPVDVVSLSYPDADGNERSAWFLKLTEDEGEGLRLKNAASERLVPVHPELERLGFIWFAQAAGENGQSRIFHTLKPGAYGRLTAKWGEWFSKYLRGTCGVTDRRVVFHSFRHTFKDYARHAGILEGVQRQIMGHSGDDVADEYGTGHSLYRLVEGMKLYRLPGVRLPA